MTDLEKLDVAMRAKIGIIWIRTQEELRLERMLAPLAAGQNYALWTWTCTVGLVEIGQQAQKPETVDFASAIRAAAEFQGRAMVLFCDAAAWITDPIAQRLLRDMHRKLPTIPKAESKQFLFVDRAPVPETLPGVSQLDWTIPDRDAIGRILDDFLSFAPDKIRDDVATNGNREALVGAMLGLSAEDASNALSRSQAAVGRFDVSLISAEKARIVKGSGLEWYDPDKRGFAAIGGYAELKNWLARRKAAFSQKARDYGLPAPKGVLLLGIPGSGKSLTAKCIAAAWKLPLLRMDVGSLFSKFVGESEGAIRKALSTAATIAPCILWLDEIEKAFGGAGGESDGGTSARVFGTFLTWLQERPQGVFVVATANNVSRLPAEFLRAGRWDEIFFCGLPNGTERAAIAAVMAGRFAACSGVDCAVIAQNSEKYTGAEIEQAFIDAQYTAFDDKARPVETVDIVGALKARVPLSVTMREDIDRLTLWAKGRARAASAVDIEPARNERAIE